MHSSRMRTGRALTVWGGASQKDFFWGKEIEKKKKKKIGDPPKISDPPERLETPPPRDQARYPLLVDRQTPVNLLPWPNFIAAGNYPIG